MARSFRHRPIFGITTARSEEQDKRQANRRLRRLARVAIDQRRELVPLLREVSNVWSFARDGCAYYADASKRDMRK